jgi:hypothetical protein
MIHDSFAHHMVLSSSYALLFQLAVICYEAENVSLLPVSVLIENTQRYCDMMAQNQNCGRGKYVNC